MRTRDCSFLVLDFFGGGGRHVESRVRRKRVKGGAKKGDFQRVGERNQGCRDTQGHGNTGRYTRIMGIHRDTQGYRGIQRDTQGNKGDTGIHGYTGIHGDTQGYRGYRNTQRYMGI